MKRIFLSAAGALLVFAVVPKVASATPPAATMQQDTQPQKAKVFSGTVIKNGDNFILSDAANKLSFVLDDPREASQFEGKKVKVTGTVDVASNTIHVETIQEIA